MEGGQKSEISLESGLDVKSSDQLVPVSKPLFQHNRQRFQGSTLPTSLRYEHNGWACGWDVYEFEVDVTSVETSPAGYTVIRQKLNDNPTYIFRVRSGTTVFAQIWYNAEDTDNTGGITISHDVDNYHIVTISGDNNGHEFAIEINVITGDISYDENSGWYVEESKYEDAVASSGIATLNLTDLDSWVQFNAAIVEAESVAYNGTSIADYYSCDGNTHVWKDTSGGGWEISYNTESDECLVNGEAAALLSNPNEDSGRLSIEYDTEYKGDVDLSASCEEFYFQITDPYAKQTTQYVDTNNVSTESFAKWSIALSGDNYLYPVFYAQSGVIISGYVPTWCGATLEYATGAGVTGSDLEELSAAEGYSLVPQDSVFSARAWLVSSEYFSLYSGGAVTGYSGKLWMAETEFPIDTLEDDSDAVSEGSYGTITAVDVNTQDDVVPKFTYCVCVFNTIKVKEEYEGEYSYDVPLQTLGEDWFDITELATWLDSFTVENKSGNTLDFEAGFYMPVAYYTGDNADAGWYLAPNGEAQPDLYPNSYSEDEIVGSGDYAEYVRLEFPYASYDIEVECEPYLGSQYLCDAEESASIASDVGKTCIDLSLALSNRVWSDANDDGKEYTLGEGGYLVPYFYSTSEGENYDTRSLDNVVSSTGENSLEAGVSVTFDITKGPLYGCTIRMAIVKASTSIYRYDFWVNNTSQIRSKINSIRDEYEDEGWTYVGANWSRAGYYVSWLKVNFVKNVSRFYIYIGGSLVQYLSSDSEGDLSNYLDGFYITPLCAYYKAIGCGDSDSLSSSSKLYLSVCFPGYFQQRLNLMVEAGVSDYTFTSSNLLGMLTLTEMGQGSLVHSSGFYIDRTVDSGTYFGMKLVQLNISSVSISNEQATLRMYLSPADDSENETFYLQSGSDADCYIPGQVYYGDAGKAGQGYSLSASNLGSTYTSSALTFSITGDVAAFYRVSSVLLTWAVEDGVHGFYDDCLPSAVSELSVSGTVFGSASNTGKGNASATQTISLVFGGNTVQIVLYFLLSGGAATTAISVSSDTETIEYGGYPFTFGVESYSWGSTSNSITLSATVPLHYSLTARLPYQYNYGNSLTYEDGKYYEGTNGLDDLPVSSYATGYNNSSQIYSFVVSGRYSYTYNGSTKEVTYGTTSYDTEPVGDARTVEIDALEALSLSFLIQGPYKTSDSAEIVSFDNEKITFLYDGQEYTFDFTTLILDEAKNALAFMYTDTRDDGAVPTSHIFAVQDTSSEYQFLRQAWNTLVEVENYWWIDADTILELNKETLTVLRKVSSFSDYDEETDIDVDDWGGDAWKIAFQFDRGDYLDNTVARYGVTDAYGGAVPRFWTVKLASTKSISITFYTLSGSDYSWSLDGVPVTVPVNNVSIGSALNARANSLNTYSQLSAESLIYEAKYSGTVIDQHILFGIHHDNNFNQWALDISTDGDLNLVVQGYGFVGLDGSLTGGEIPSAYFNAALGFDDTVYPIDEIEQEDIEYVDSLSEFTALEAEGKVIGDESQQWYITKNLTGIVSHLTWNGSSWDTVVLPISNNYACVYGSPSYGKRLISDFSLWAKYLSYLMGEDSVFSDAVSDLTSIMDVKVYGYSPKITTALYLQQTVGQYAYVHYNSEKPGKQRDLSREDTSDHQFGEFGVNGTAYTPIGVAIRKEDEPVDAVTAGNSDDFSFNLHGLRQSISIDKPWSGDFGIMLVIFCGMSSIMSALSSVLDTIKVNEKNSQISASDFGRKFGQNFLYNMDNLATMDKTIIGVLPTLQSAVGASCTLDMFYSTSEGQKVRAGPGWVQHNLVAQCVAQSVTSCQWEMQQIGMLWIPDGLATISAKVTYLLAQVTWEITVEECNALKEQTVMSTNVGAAIAMTTLAIAGAVYAVTATYKIVAEIADMFIKSICGGTARVDMQNASSKHTYDVEGKHRYGQKSQVFMWPCFSVNDVLEYTNETVDAVLTNHEWNLHVPLTSGQSFMGGTTEDLGTIKFSGVLGADRQDEDVISNFDGDIKYIIANCKSKRDDATTTLPSDMAAVIGSDSFLSPVPFRNENIGVSAATFPTPCIQDYIIDKDWELSRTATDGWTLWVSCKDTKLIDGEPSNIVVSDEFCGVACPYTAIEVKRGCEQKYIRPWAITPNALALNQTGYNCCYDRKAYHAFDGYGGRIVKWCGAAGMNKEGRVWQYSFIVNDRFKRSNKVPLNEFIGNFMGDPIIALRTTGEDWVFNHVTDYTGGGRGFQVGSIGEDKDTRRYAVPVFSEFVSTLPAVLKTISSYNLSVIDGITSLTSDNRDLQSAYKAPISVDFAIGKDKYRFTEEYISRLKIDQQGGVTTLEDIVPTLGLTFLGATPYEAYLYSAATRQYYTYSGGPRLDAVDMIERFRDVVHGRYDFVNQEVAVPCIATFVRLDKHVHDDEDERDNTMVPRLKEGKFVGEVAPPLETIYNMRSGFRTISLPSGLCYQGPNRCIINRFVYSDYMKEQIKENYGKWKRVPRERYHPFRVYEDEYERVDENIESTLVGWTHNPFLLVTSPLGMNSETDCVYEWEITFAWPVEMDELYSCGQYAVVNILAECFTPGGKAIPDRPAHVFLWKDLFTRTGNYGYYSFRYQSRCGAGNRERLHIWSDQYIAVSGLQVEVKPVTEKRTEILTQQVDVMEMEEI